jgi:hypothetical protein
VTPDRCPNGSLWKPSCKRRSCSFCGPRWARDWQRVLGVNLEAVGVPVATIAITGPGADRLPWDEDYCLERRVGKRHRHSGGRGCRVQQRALREWSDTLTYRWQLYRQAARIATKRELGYAPPWVLCRVWEPQKRGVPHLHLVVPFGSPYEQQAARVFLKHLKRLAGDYDFGHVGRHKGPDLQAIEGREAARYLANYLAGRTNSKTSIRANIADPLLPRSLLWLTPKLTRETMVTMRTLRRARHLWAAAAGVCPVPRWAGLEEAVQIVTVFRRIYPKRAGPPGDVDGALAWAHSIAAAVDRNAPVLEYDGFAWMRNESYDRELARVAFQVTHDPEWRRDDQREQGIAPPVAA